MTAEGPERRGRRPAAVLIAGPTASGKSALALKLAQASGGTVINTDLMQVYRDLRIITARPTPDEEALAPHRLYGTVDAAVNFSSRGLCRCRRCGAGGHARGRGRLPILIGGTGLRAGADARSVGGAVGSGRGLDARAAAARPGTGCRRRTRSWRATIRRPRRGWRRPTGPESRGRWRSCWRPVWAIGRLAPQFRRRCCRRTTWWRYSWPSGSRGAVRADRPRSGRDAGRPAHWTRLPPWPSAGSIRCCRR